MLLLAAVVVLATSLWGVRSLGHLLHHADPLERADAIFVLGGSWLERIAEGGDLYLEGRAPLVVLSRELPDYGEQALRSRGLDVPAVTDVQVQVLMKMGVPHDAIQVIEPQPATATEAAALKQLALSRGWRTVIVVTDKMHTARARLVIQRHLHRTSVRILMRGTRYDPVDLNYWWRSRSDLRFALIEAQKLVLYWIGVAD